MSTELTPHETALSETISREYRDAMSQTKEVKGILAPGLTNAPVDGLFLSGTFRNGKGPRDELNVTLLQIQDLRQGPATGVFERSITDPFDATGTVARLRTFGCFKLGEWLRYMDQDVDSLREKIELTEWDVGYAAYYAKHYAHKVFPAYETPIASPEG